jgi:hypothetical protein
VIEEVCELNHELLRPEEAENQIITDYEVYARRSYDSDLLVAAIETHQARLGRMPRLVAADAAFYSAKNEAAAKAKGVKRVSASASPIVQPIVRNASASRESAGSATAKNGAPDPRGTSAWSTAPQPQALPLQGLRRNEPVGRARCHRRQRCQHRSRDRKKASFLARR